MLAMGGTLLDMIKELDLDEYLKGVLWCRC